MVYMKPTKKESYDMRALNLTLLTDLYELTMMQGYFKNPTDQVVVFDAFYRKNPCEGGYAITDCRIHPPFAFCTG